MRICHKFFSVPIPSLLVIFIFSFSLIFFWYSKGQAQSLSSLTNNENIGKQAKTFLELPPEEQKKALEKLSADQAAQVFSKLSDKDKVTFFGKLDKNKKQDIFPLLSQDDQELIFKCLNDGDRALLFHGLPKAQQRFLLAKFPSLSLILEQEKIPSGIKTKPSSTAKVSKAPTAIEKILSGKFPEDVSNDLRLFGYDFFDKDVSTFAPVDNVPVGDNYVIGPGDNFTIHLWGKAEKTYDVTVSRDGTIFVSRLGNLKISGLTFAELKKFLYRKFKEFYPHFDLSITMGRLRSIQIFIVGEAARPGTYSVSSLSTVIPALYAAGGAKQERKPQKHTGH